jgi:hypothetical protein
VLAIETSLRPVDCRITKLYRILRRIDPLLGNDLVNTVPQESTRARIGRPLLGNGSANTPKKYQTIEDGVSHVVSSEAI